MDFPSQLSAIQFSHCDVPFSLRERLQLFWGEGKIEIYWKTLRNSLKSRTIDLTDVWRLFKVSDNKPRLYGAIFIACSFFGRPHKLKQPHLWPSLRLAVIMNEPFTRCLFAYEAELCSRSVSSSSFPSSPLLQAQTENCFAKIVSKLEKGRKNGRNWISWLINLDLMSWKAFSIESCRRIVCKSPERLFGSIKVPEPRGKCHPTTVPTFKYINS